MITLRRAEERGHGNHGWLNSYHTFSFANYYDPNHMGFRALRVINDDRVQAGRGFGAHGHRDMEILSYVLEGHVAHKDSMGEEGKLGPNMVQSMSAGSGVIHSEFNPSATEDCHFLQIWILPDKHDVPPSYQQFAYDPKEKHGKFRLIAGPQKNSNPPSAFIHSDTNMYAAVVTPGEALEYQIPAGRHAWVHCATGNITVNGIEFKEGDGAAISEEAALNITGAGELGGEFLLFDLA
ncbi:MAG: pirin family protein [Bryobacteraceae bacterium]